MADTKISQLTDGGAAQSTDQIPVNRGGANFRLTATAIAALVGGGTVTSVAGKTGAVTLVEGDIASLTTDLAATEKTANKGQANGYAGLDSTGKVPTTQLPSTTGAVTSVAGKTGVVTLVEGDIANLTTDLANTQPALGFTPENTANKGVASGYASLDGTGKVPTAQLPSGSSPTYPVTVAGTVNSGGVPYFSSPTQESSSAALANNSVVLGGGAGLPPETVAGITSDGVSALTLGVAGTSVGSINFNNASSGTITLAPPTGALGFTSTLPAHTGTLAQTNYNQSWSGTQTYTTIVINNQLTIGLQGQITAATSGISNTETLITKSTTAMVASRLNAGTVIRATWIGTCTSTGANASTFAIRYGTAGTVADGLFAQAVSAAAATSGTSIAFRAVMEITLYTVGTTTTGAGTLTLYNQGSTGIATTAIQVIPVTMTSINTTTANTRFDLTYVSAGSTTTVTFTQAFIELVHN